MLTRGLVSARISPTPQVTTTSCLAALMTLALGSLASAGGPQFVDQTFTRFPTPALSEYTNQLTVGDLDGDDDLDIVFANGAGFSSASTPLKLRIFINDGTGVFTDQTDARTGGMTFIARGAELGDVDRDGDLDIIVAQDFNRQPTLLINDGNGFFTNGTVGRLPIGTFSSTRAQFADVDNDGDLDLYLTNGGAVSRFGAGVGKLWLNNGSGVFTDVTATNMPPQAISEPQDCIFGDLDGDLDLDLRIGSTATNQGKIYFNNGSGVFSIGAAPADNNCYSYDLGDMDGNGSLDMIGANAHPTSINSELQLFNNGAGVFSQGAFTGASTDDNDSKFIDIDNDGDLDIVIASLGSTERIYVNNGSGGYSLLNGAITAVADSSLDVKVADVNADGRYDIITAQGESGSFTNRIYMNVDGPVDTIPPRIVKVEQISADDAPGPFVVRAVIYDAHSSDRGFHARGVSVWWRHGGTGPFFRVAMDWSGNSLWRGVIPAQGSAGLIEYYVTARDFNFNQAQSDTYSLCFGIAADCNLNCVEDADDIASGESLDCNLNGIPDDCEVDVPPCPESCAGDIVDSSTFAPPPDGTVDGADLAYLLGAWGRHPGSPADIVSNRTFQPPPDGMVDAADLAYMLGAWGACD